MKKLTLDQAWKLCMAQWDWIIEQLDDETNAFCLKVKWLRQRGYKTSPSHSCFFCEYNDQNGGDASESDCFQCPGKLISRSFYCENNETYNWYEEPRKFHAELQKLYKKYQESK